MMHGDRQRGSYNANITYTSSARYSDWKDDKLWLPSVTEVGYRPLIGDDFVGLWNLSDAQKKQTKILPMQHPLHLVQLG